MDGHIDSTFSHKRYVILYFLGLLCVMSNYFFHSDLSLHSHHRAHAYLIWNGTTLCVEDHISEEATLAEPAVLSPILLRPIPINEASQALLMTIPGIGEKLSKKILHQRSLKGPFRSANDLKLINGIGEKRFLVFEKSFSYR
jgi:hypothetical protein